VSRDDDRRAQADGAVIDVMSDAARRIAADAAGPGPTPAAWHRLQLARARVPRRSPRRGLLLLGAGAAAMLALFIVVRGLQRARPLTYAVGGGAVEQDGYIRRVSDTDSEIRFSDGTRVDLARGARVLVVSRGAQGARLRVEDGEARFEVVHRPHASWSVEAGPYVVYVTGTVFAVRWSGADEVVEVRMRSGSVQVSGPLLPERVTLRAGQNLTARLASGELHILDSGTAAAGTVAAAPAPEAARAAHLDVVAAQPSATPPPALAPAAGSGAPRLALPPPEQPPAGAAAAGDGPVAGEAPAAAAAVRRTRPREANVAAAESWGPQRWAGHVASGNARAVLAEAEAHGLDRTFIEVDGTALAALSDAARYAGRHEVAVRAMMAQRQRFPRTPAAQAAAFLLGRLSDDQGEPASGLAWYRRYLSEAPEGAYVAEALGRKMLAVERLSGRAAARDVAVEYLRRFPNGTYLLQAHSILANP
jgi:ferric-dicitrate binding protein FerR (iron transport regulator)